jgi:hypothetical protein
MQLDVPSKLKFTYPENQSAGTGAEIPSVLYTPEFVWALNFMDGFLKQ